MKSAIYAVLAAALFLSAIAIVEHNDSRYEYAPPVVAYVDQ